MIEIERARGVSEDDLAKMWRLAVILKQDFRLDHIDPALVQEIIDSPHHELILARKADKVREVVGMTSVSLIMGPVVGGGGGKKVWMEDMVVSPNERGQGIASKLFQEGVAWAREHGAKYFEFTSSRPTTYGFYEKNGAKIRDETEVFRLEL